MDRTDNALRAAIKALEEVVAPAVDPADPLARQQLKLVVDSLRFLRSRLDHLHDRDRFEVRHYLTLAASIADDAQDRGLNDAIEAGAAIYARADARTPDLKAAAAQLAAAVRTVVRDAAGTDAQTRRRIELAVVAGSRERIQADRAWHVPQGFDPDPGSVIALDAALGVQPAQ